MISQPGCSTTTLSGGEAQRVKLSRELSKRATGLGPEGGDEGGQVVMAELASILCWVGLIAPGRRRLWLQ